MYYDFIFNDVEKPYYVYEWLWYMFFFVIANTREILNQLLLKLQSILRSVSYCWPLSWRIKVLIKKIGNIDMYFSVWIFAWTNSVLVKMQKYTVANIYNLFYGLESGFPTLSLILSILRFSVIFVWALSFSRHQNIVKYAHIAIMQSKYTVRYICFTCDADMYLKISYEKICM